MSTSNDFIEYITDELERLSVGLVRSKKMFGEYMIYIDDRPILLICDNTIYVKILACSERLMPSAERGFPYKYAKEHFILDIEDSELTKDVISELLKVIPIPKPKVKKR